jgi:hypothetical protein
MGPRGRGAAEAVTVIRLFCLIEGPYGVRLRSRAGQQVVVRSLADSA